MCCTVQIGDHAYNLGAENGLRGDGYLQAYSRLVSRVVWVPIIGNHEWYDGDDAHRWLNQTNFVPMIDAGHMDTASPWEHRPRHAESAIPVRSTATSALGHTLSRATWLGVATRPNQAAASGRSLAYPPSNTSRFFSVDLGLGHFIALDSNVYVNKLDTQWADAQLEWLEKDLASVDRSVTPWVIAMAHHPLHISAQDSKLPASWYTSDEAETAGISNPTDQVVADFKDKLLRCDLVASAAGLGSGVQGGHDCPLSAGNVTEAASESWEQLFQQFGVDFFIAGHWHEYESLWPNAGGKPTQFNFTNPRAPIHITAGNGGAPGPDHFSSRGPNGTLINHTALPMSRKRFSGGNALVNGYVAVSNSAGYIRMSLLNASTAKVEYVLNTDSSVYDEFVVSTESHGPFPNLSKTFAAQ